MEFADGGSLLELTSVFGKLPEQTAVIYLKQILDGLVYLHELNVIHRDIKPQNILLNSQGVVKVSDFGCSQEMLTSQTKEELMTHLKGSIPYMAPEALRLEHLSRKGDVWSLGCLLLELVTGVPPWNEFGLDNVISLMYKIGCEDIVPEIDPSLSELLKDFISLCLKRDINERATSKDLLIHPIFKTIQSPQTSSSREMGTDNNINN